MTLSECTRRVDAIRNASDDDELAHVMEAALWADVLRAIRDGETEGCTPAELASCALRSLNIDFARWCG